MTAADVKTRAAAALAELGNTPDAVADRLRALNIKGFKDDGECCPIAIYLRRIDGLANVDVATTYVLPTCGFLHVDNPEPVAEFIRRFDRGVYLDLVADEQVA